MLYMEKPEQYLSAETGNAVATLHSFHLQDWIEAGKPAAAVIVATEDTLAEHYTDLLSAPRITIEFAGFMDGRGFSHAAKLRQLGFKGELVAGGDVLADQWVFLQRCGFDALDNIALTASAETLPGISERYQADARELEPLFRRKRSA
ncbi:conserved hypothetical protein [gamma proteobacterium NOR5-3]|nr:conserved hypothetical protein [gamma proteobacterium NOR5-3]